MYITIVISIETSENCSLPISIDDIVNQEIDDESILNISTDFPRLNTFQNNECKYYTSNTINNIFDDCNHNIDNTVNLIHINIRGLEKHFDDLITYLSTFSVKFDVICLSEAHLHDKNSHLIRDRFEISEYISYKLTSTIKYGGCVVYVRNTLQSSIISNLTESDHMSDHLFINIEIPGSKKKLCVAAYYRHNKRGKDTINEFTDQLDSKLGSVNLKNKHVIVVGDMNIDLCKLAVNKETELYFNTFLCHNFESHINSPSRIQYNSKSSSLVSATIIDHIFSNLSSYKCSAGNIAYADSDHFANFLSVSLLNNKQSLKGIQDKLPLYKRNYTNINVENLLTDFENIDWKYNVINHRVSLNEAVLSLIANLTALCDKHAPMKKVPKRKINYIYKPWITKKILPLIIAKNKMAAKRHQCPDKFKKIRNHVNNVINRSRNEYFKKYFIEHSKNAKKVWEGIRCAIEWHKTKSSNITSVTDTSGIKHNDPKSITTAFANYFKDIPHKCVSKISQGNENTYNDYLFNPNSKSMVLFDTDKYEIYNIINTLKSNKSPGPLQFSNHFIKLLNQNLSPRISHLVNRSFHEAIMPECLKIGKQTPVFKGGKNIVSNYRPITVVNSIAKIFEKVVSVRLTGYLNHFNILTDSQFGFRPQHATSHAMIKLYDTALAGLDDKTVKTGAVLLDISKAFDCVNHDILISKLQHYGIRGFVCDWFKSFLTNRSHYVDINGAKSEPYSPDMGVPQGSVLGPILFLVYINDLPTCSRFLNLPMIPVYCFLLIQNYMISK